jgi:hypothetical protein
MIECPHCNGGIKMPDINAMTNDELCALIIKLFARIEALERENEALRTCLRSFVHN